MTVIQLQTENFESLTSRKGVVLIDAWASWCGACKSFEQVFEAVAEAHPEHAFAQLDTQEEPVLSSQLRIAQLPTLLVYRDGELLYREAGAPPEEALEELIRQALALDMDALRAERAQEAPEQEDH